MGKLSAGDRAPRFTLPDQDDNLVSLKDFAGQRVVVYFYPRDDTPGCTKEACQFNDNLRAFTRAKVPVLGISADSAEKHRAFRSKYRTQVPAAHRCRPQGGRGLRGMGREDPVRQEDDRGHPLDVPDRRGR